MTHKGWCVVKNQTNKQTNRHCNSCPCIGTFILESFLLNRRWSWANDESLVLNHNEYLNLSFIFRAHFESQSYNVYIWKQLCYTKTASTKTHILTWRISDGKLRGKKCINTFCMKSSQHSISKWLTGWEYPADWNQQQAQHVSKAEIDMMYLSKQKYEW